ncbi:MAG: CBS domain-containing protein [Anaerolineales bacterium]|nr:CBS domain-containing protein [Anaerolineales bacterium]MDW8226767.1 CBS domain-containing protein [Anaerolineales bacterium]
MNTVKQILRLKGKQVWKVSKNATVLEALKVMAEKGVSAVVVMDGGHIAGIFTERDFARKVGLYEIKPSEIKVGDVMTGELITITQNETVSDCMRIMTEKRIRHLPVVEDGQLVGIISIGDVVKDLIDELQFMVEQLENYIRGLR